MVTVLPTQGKKTQSQVSGMAGTAAQSKAPEQNAPGQKLTHGRRDSPNFSVKMGLYHPSLSILRPKPPRARGFPAFNHFIAHFGVCSAWAALANHHIPCLMRGLAQH